MWVLLWKFVLIFTLVAYSIMFVITTIGGFGDIKHLFEDLKNPDKSDE